MTWKTVHLIEWLERNHLNSRPISQRTSLNHLNTKLVYCWGPLPAWYHSLILSFSILWGWSYFMYTATFYCSNTKHEFAKQTWWIAKELRIYTFKVNLYYKQTIGPGVNPIKQILSSITSKMALLRKKLENQNYKQF